MDKPRIGPRIGARVGTKGRTSGLAVAKDAASGIYCPESAEEWDTLLDAAGLSSGAPSHLWLHQEAVGTTLADSIGADTMTEAGGGFAYSQSQAGWTRKGITVPDGNSTILITSATYDSSTLFLSYIGLTDTPAASRSVMYAQGEVGIETDRHYSGDSATGTADAGTTLVRPVLIKADRTGAVTTVYTDQEVIPQTHTPATNIVGFGSLVQNSGPFWAGYTALFTGADAELSDANVRSLLQMLGWTVAW